MKPKVNRRASEKGQVVILVITGLSIFLLAALGLAIDTSQLYAQRQMAQAAADAAAQAGIMSILDGTNTAANNNAFGTASFACAKGSTLTPCYYARLNGFGPENGDTVQVDFPTSANGVSGLASGYTANLVSVTVIRPVQTTLIRFAGAATSSVAGHATAALLLPPLPIPIVVTHPTLPDAFQVNGNATIKINNGPTVSIQVNSCAGRGTCQKGVNSVLSSGNNNTVDLSTAGPNGTPGKFGNTGAPDTWAQAGNGTLTPANSYVSPTSPVTDPLASITQPTSNGRPTISNVTPSATNVAPNPCIVNATGAPNACQGSNTYGCPSLCSLYFPGIYPNGISLSSPSNVLFMPGVYYMSNTGFVVSGQVIINMASGAGAGSNAETGTGMTVFLTGTSLVSVTGQAALTLQGDTLGTYGGALFFEDRNETGHLQHQLAGTGGLNLTGTIYLSRGTTATAANYNSLTISGNGGSNTTLNGEIIVDAFTVAGNGTVTFNLSSTSREITQVALVQ